MSSFAASPTRQRFLARFEPDGDDFLYRRRPDAMPVRISAKDHAFMIDAFDTDWLRLPFVAALAIACAALFIWLAFTYADRPNGHILRDVAIPFSALWFVGAWYADLWDVADRALFQRAKEMGRTKSLPWLTKSASDLSWKSMTLIVFWGLPLVDRIFVDRSLMLWDRFFFGLFVIAVVLNVLSFARKVQLNQARSLPYLNEVH